VTDAAPGGEYRFYTELAAWWPLISPPQEHAEEAAFFCGLLNEHPRTVTTVPVLGSGGGHNAMHLKADLRRAVDTAFLHCRPGGVAVFVPDDTAEAFEATTDHGGIDGSDGRAARYLAWTWDPEPNDTSTVTEYAFVLRDAGGTVRVVHETHHCGLFGRDLWLRVLGDAGFSAKPVTEQTDDDRTAREIFIGHRPERASA
jgi:hypothetical protein